MNKTVPEIPDFTTSELINSYSQGLKEAVDFMGAPDLVNSYD